MTHHPGGTINAALVLHDFAAIRGLDMTSESSSVRDAGAHRRRRQCHYPGCERPTKPANPGGGRPPAYCSDPDHNKATNYATRQRRTATATYGPDLERDPETDGVVSAEMDADPSGGTTPSEQAEPSCPQALLRRLKEARELAAQRARRLEDADARADRREAELLERLLAARDEINALRRELEQRTQS